jgi:hypothetical protein
MVTLRLLVDLRPIGLHCSRIPAHTNSHAASGPCSDPTNLLDLLDAVFQRSDKAKRRPVIWRQWLAVHLIDEQRLGM